MSTICSKHRQRSEADSLSRIGKMGTIKDLNFRRDAPFPRKGGIGSMQTAENSIVLGTREPDDGRFQTTKATSFTQKTSMPPNKEHVAYMQGKHFQFSNDPPTAEESMMTESRGMLRAPPPGFANVEGHKKKSNESSILMGDASGSGTSTMREMFKRTEVGVRDDNRFATALHNRGTHFALGNEPGQWSSVQRETYDEKALPGIKGKGRPITDSVQFGSVDIPPTFESTTKAIYQGHGARRKSKERKQNSSHVIFGHENRECKSTNRGDFKDTNFVPEALYPSVKLHEKESFTVKQHSPCKESPLHLNRLREE